VTDFNWCHGPECHTYKTQDRVRGSGDNKVIRTKKVTNKSDKSMFGNGGSNIWNFFCCHHCLMDYMAYYTNEVVAIAPRREALEIPVKIEKEKYESYRYRWRGSEHIREPYTATKTLINLVDND
jgi:hypothetical protein